MLTKKNDQKTKLKKMIESRYNTIERQTNKFLGNKKRQYLNNILENLQTGSYE